MANLTTNVDVDYIQKDFNSSVDAIISFANVNFGPGTSANRLWTNFNADSFSRNWLEIVAFVSDVFFFYFDNQATQSYLQTATVRSAIEDIAKQFGFVPATATSASGVATFTTTGAVTIPRGFRVSSTNGQEFFVVSDIVAVSAGTFSGSVIQGTITTEGFVAEGLQSEEFDLQSQDVIRDQDNINPLDITPQVTVNGNTYTLVDSFIRHNGEDTAAVVDSLGNVIGGGGRVFTLEERPSGVKFIKFGDGIFGRKINPGETISIIYRAGGGSAGNIAAESLVTLVDSDSNVTAVINNSDFSGGSDEQSIEQLRELIPASLRTLERAVAESDYSDILEANFSEVFAASTEPNTEDPGIDLNVYVVPQGAGITNITDNTLLKNRLENFIDRRKMVTVQFQISDAFAIDTLITLEVFISNTASKSTVTSSIKTAIANFFDLSTGGVTETGIGFAENLLLTDLDNLIRSVPGVDRFEIKRLTYRPRIDKNVIGLLSSYNDSDVTLFPTVSESEWLLAAGGTVNETAGVIIFNNDDPTGYTYTSGDGTIAYSFPVDLGGVAPGDRFVDGVATEFTILAVDTVNSTLIIPSGQSVDLTAGIGAGGSIKNGTTDFESYKVFKKILANATNLSVDSITDNNLDLSVFNGTATALSARVLLDNTSIFKPSQYSTGDFYLVDSAGNIWEIVQNDSNTLTTSITAVNDAIITSVAGGDYKIVSKMNGRQVLFKGSIFSIQFNSDKTVFSVGAQFSQIGTIGDEFQLSELQSNLGNLGIALDLISFDPATKELRLNSSPDLEGVSSDYVLADSDGQLFNVVGVDNESKPSVFYDTVNQDNEVLLEGSALGSQISQGFQVAATDTYAVVSFNLRKQGNILGNLTAKIVDDIGGLPDLSSVVASSDTIDVLDLSETSSKTVFSFVTPPTLSAATQYHLVLSGDTGYASSEQNNIKSFDNTGLVTFSYNGTSGVVDYGSAVNLSNVLPGHFFQDSGGTLFKILAVNDTDDEVTLATGLTVDNSVPTVGDDGAIIIFDRVLVGIDVSAPTYADGEFSVFDGATQWSNSTLGPDDFTGNPYPLIDGTTLSSDGDLIFSVEGTKTITVESDLTPALGPGATVTERYYDDENEISLVLGLSSGSITFATDANALGKGTVASVPNRSVDNFVFRTSRFADDIVNLRKNEIPQIQDSDITVNIFGGVD